MTRTHEADVVVIGSGPGGATTAALLAEAGRDVLLVEEGHHWTLDSAPSYSLAEMDQKYRNGGLNTTFGKTNITYVEGRCVGGGSEVNAGLYHRPLTTTLQAWRDRFQIENFDPEELWPFFEAVERDFSVSRFPNGPGPSSLTLRAGADKLGWKTAEIQRFWKYSAAANPSPPSGRRQSMTETMIPRALAAGARILADTIVTRLHWKGSRATGATGRTQWNGSKQLVELRFRELFVCAGAVQSPLLLRRSSLTRHIGDSLRLHPMVRVVAAFDKPVNDPAWGVPVEQIEEFKPELTLGCSHSSIPHLALWMGGEGPVRRDRLRRYDHAGVYYVAAVGTGQGKVRDLPVLHEPIVRLPLTPQDLDRLGEGLYRLGQALFAAGAKEISHPVEGEAPIRAAGELDRLRSGLPQGRMSVSTIHLFSSIPMGEDASQCAVDSFGKLHGFDNVRVNDGSILPLSPGVNPQGTILALARRNAERFLG